MLAVTAWLILAPQTVDLTFVRHGETEANASGKYNGKTLNTLSAKGEAQVKALTAELTRQRPFDVIYVSPSPRAMKTIAPYLKATHRKAWVWPLLYECCTGQKKASKATSFQYGSEISIPEDLRPYFDLIPGNSRYPTSGADYAAGLAQVDATVNVFTQIANGRVLLVGHSGHGGQFLYRLTGKHFQVKNATVMNFPHLVVKK